MRTIVICFALITLLTSSGCSSPIDGSQYHNISPKFELEQFFTGKVKAWGIVQNRDGQVVQRFTVDIIGQLENQTLTLDETFNYEIGEGPTTRIWRIQKQSDNNYTGNASDITSDATGTIYGNALRWQYQMNLPVDGSNYQVNFDDWMWLFNDGTLINRSYIKKFGITFAEVTIFMQKQ